MFREPNEKKKNAVTKKSKHLGVRGNQFGQKISVCVAFVRSCEPI